jgi:hypothetical protein
VTSAAAERLLFTYIRPALGIGGKHHTVKRSEHAALPGPLHAVILTLVHLSCHMVTSDIFS